MRHKTTYVAVNSIRLTSVSDNDSAQVATPTHKWVGLWVQSRIYPAGFPNDPWFASHLLNVHEMFR